MFKIDPMAMLARSHRSKKLRWLLGLRNFNLMPQQPGQDPMARLRARLVSTVEALLAFLLSVMTLLVGGLAGLIGGPRSLAWVLVVGGAVAVVLVIRSIWRSRRADMPDAGFVIVAAVLNLLMVAGAVLIFWRAGPAV